MGERQRFVLYVLICLEVGIFLMIVPWLAIWERNYFLEAYPALGPIFLDPVFRGGVAGLGLGNIYLGLREVFDRSQVSSHGGIGDVELSFQIDAQQSVCDGKEIHPSEPQPLVMRHNRS